MQLFIIEFTTQPSPSQMWKTLGINILHDVSIPELYEEVRYDVNFYNHTACPQTTKLDLIIPMTPIPLILRWRLLS